MPTATKKTTAKPKTAKTAGNVSIVTTPPSTGNSTIKKTYVTFILDRSGSMGSCIEATISGFNEQLETLKKDAAQAGELYVSLYTFADDVRQVFHNESIDRVQPLTTSNYRTAGCTAYYDAMGTALMAQEPSDDKTNSDIGFLIIAITDGHENSSKEWNAGSVQNKVKALQDSGRWTFVYVGAGQDLTAVAKSTGQNVNNMMSFTANAPGTARMASVLRSGTSNYMAARSMGSTQSEAYWGTEGPADADASENVPVAAGPSTPDFDPNNWMGQTLVPLPSTGLGFSNLQSNPSTDDYLPTGDVTRGVTVRSAVTPPVKPTRSDYS